MPAGRAGRKFRKRPMTSSLGPQDTHDARNLSVVLVIGQLGLGGTERQLVLLAKGLRSSGLDVHVYCLWATGPRAEELEQVGVPVRYLHFPKFREGLVRPWVLAGRLSNLVVMLRTDSPQVVHAFLFHAYVVSAFAARLARVPVFVSGRRSLARFKDGHPVARYMEKAANSLTDAFVANCNAVALDALEYERLPPHKMHVICNAIDTDDLPEPVLRLDSYAGVSRVICVANFRTYKGHVVLLDALAEVKKQGHNLSVTFVGDGPERVVVSAHAAARGLDVRLLGERRDVPQLLAQHDILLSASLEEGMSNSIMEAMAAGLAVVATDVGGTPELIGDAGLLVPPNDSAAFAIAVLKLVCDAGLCARLGVAARERVSARYSSEALAAKHIALYRALVTRAGLK